MKTLYYFLTAVGLLLFSNVEAHLTISAELRSVRVRSCPGGWAVIGKKS